MFPKECGNGRESGFKTATIFTKDTCWNKMKEVEHKTMINSYDNLAGVEMVCSYIAHLSYRMNWLY